MCQNFFIKICHGLNSEKWWYISQVGIFTLQPGAFQLGSRWQALSIPGTKERAPSNIYRGANIVYRFQGRSIFSVCCGM